MRTDVESYPGGVLMGGMSLKDPYMNIAHRRMWRCNGERQLLFSSLLDALLVVLMALTLQRTQLWHSDPVLFKLFSRNCGVSEF
jgi:hypothetical protein